MSPGILGMGGKQRLDQYDNFFKPVSEEELRDRRKNSIGKITSGINSNASILSVINFVYSQLPFWRDDPDRPYTESEKQLNSQLSKFLDLQAKELFSMFHFGHEEPQFQNRSIDISVSPTEYTIIEAKSYSIYDPVLVIECKRLPAPTADREKEYVSGTLPNKISGGIQRFKLGLHGAKHELVAMIGYIQEHFDRDWCGVINGWITELAANPIGDGCVWSDDELLALLEKDTIAGVIKYHSTHQRKNASTDKIEMYHLWVLMKKENSVPSAAKKTIKSCLPNTAL
jgi:hypothetical protein